MDRRYLSVLSAWTSFPSGRKAVRPATRGSLRSSPFEGRHAEDRLDEVYVKIAVPR